MVRINLPSGEAIDVRADDRQTFELISGENVVISPGSLTVAQISGATATISSTTITPSAVGFSKFTVTQPDGSVSTLNLATCESACLTFIGGAIKSIGYGGEADTPARRRRILRSIATERPSWFDCTSASLANHSLANYGC